MRISDWSSDVCSSDLAMLGKGALHGPDDVAALTHAAKRIVHAFGKLPAPRFDLVGKAKVPEFLQSARAQGLQERTAIRHGHDAVVVPGAQTAPVGAGQSLLLALMCQVCFGGTDVRQGKWVTVCVEL